MKKNIILTVLIIFVFVAVISSSVFAGPTDPGTGTIPSQVTTTVPNIWATFVLIVQVISIGCVVFAGVRYMFAGASQKADIKSGMINLVIGGIIVFGAITIIQAVVSII